VAESLFSAIKRQSAVADEVIVSYSGGKDSAVTLDLCHKHFKRVHVFFMYQVPGLSFQQSCIQWAEKKYSVDVYQVPHFELSYFLRNGIYCKPDPTVKKVTVKDVYAHVRAVFDADWIAAGERAKDSLVRNAMIKKSGSIDMVRSRFYPLAYWSKKDVVTYIDAHNLKTSPESAILGHSFRSFETKDMLLIREHYPKDFERIERMFPHAGAILEREFIHGKDKAPEVQH
jgi:phosphoadenosine phosphosulfate reductase